VAIIPHLIVEEFGAFVSKKSERLVVTCGGEKRAEAPLMHLETVLVAARGITLSSDAIAACAEQGIPIHVIDSRGAPVGSLYSSALTATIETRRAQLLARLDSRGVSFAKASAEGKIRNQASLLKYMAKYRKERQPAIHDEVRRLADEVSDHLAELERWQAENIDTCRGQLLSTEGRAAQKYWQAVGLLLPAERQWPGRRTQGATDAVNSAFNYGYGILYGVVERSLVLAGLDPYAGFLHVDRPGKPSLVFDLIEEFRQVVVDRTVIAMCNLGMELAQDEQHRLVESTRRTLAEKINARLDSVESYEGKRHPLRSVIQQQARHLATFLRGERASYSPFLVAW
jgi:CRISPR-associated protein Cas1